MSVAELLNRKPTRIVTGQKEDGTSYFARVEAVGEDFRSEGIGADDPSRSRVHRLWGRSTCSPATP